MQRIGGLVFGMVALLAAAAAHAQTLGPATSGTVEAPQVQTPAPNIARQPPPLFHLGQLPVGVWAPVEPNYDQFHNLSPAEYPPVWGGP